MAVKTLIDNVLLLVKRRLVCCHTAAIAGNCACVRLLRSLSCHCES